MSPSFASRARLAAAAGALATALGLAAVASLIAPREGVLAIGAAGVGLLALALVFASARFIPWALGLLAAAFIIALYVSDVRNDLVAALYGAGLLLTGELADWSFELGLPSRVDRGVGLRRGIAVGGVVAGAAAVGVVAALASTAPVVGGLALAVAGVGAVATLFVGLLAAVWRGIATTGDERVADEPAAGAPVTDS